MLRVLQVTPRFAPHVGGVETHVREVARRLPGEGIETAVLTTDESGRLAPRELISGIEVSRVRAYPRGRDWMFAPSLRAAIRDGSWDVVHVQSYHTLVAPLAMAAAAREHIPFVLTFHGGGNSSRLRNSIRRSQLQALGPLLRRAQALVAIADFEINDYGPVIGVPPSRFVRIANGADLPVVTSPIEADGKLIVSLGRLEIYKGHRRVLAAFPHVLAEEPAARLWIAGAGPDQPHLIQMARTLRIAERVEVSSTDRATVAARLHGAAAMTLLSDFESQPLAVLEAASLGVPAVVADNSGMSELAQQGFARAVPTDASPRIHADAIVAAIRGPKPQPRGDIPTWDSCARGLAGLYSRVAHS